jgi:hypothetical protein
VTKASARVLLRVELHGVDLPGRRDDPHLGLRWYGRIPDGRVENFRAAKLRFARSILPSLTRRYKAGVPLSGVSCSPTSTAGRAVPAFICQRSRGRSGRLISSGRDSGTFASAQRRLRSTE